jgi:hypothetical protein
MSQSMRIRAPPSDTASGLHDERSKRWAGQVKATGIPLLVLQHHDPHSEFLDSLAAAAVYEDPVEIGPSDSLTHNVARLHRLHLASANARAQAVAVVSPAKGKRKAAKSNKKVRLQERLAEPLTA